ncbi:MAG: xanthine dehydrogenase family protein molybdopterin-binding subunit [Candidatus Binatia bacterium]
MPARSEPGGLKRKRLRVVGASCPSLEGPATVSGSARYTVDLIFPEMLHAKLFRSPVAHARILRLDVSRARSLPGVIAVLTPADVPGRRFGFAVRDEEIFASHKVRYAGDVLGAVAAVDEETAEQALDLIEWDYEELPAALTIDEALRENAPLVHEQLGSYGMNSMMARVWQPVPGTNIAHQAVHARGNVERGFSEADEIFDDTFLSQQVQHVSLEPHAAVAQADGDRLTVWTSTQNVFQVQLELAHLFEMPESKVRVVGPKLGGGFGGKNVVLRIEQYVAALALKTGRPVKLVLSRKEEFDGAGGSVSAKIRIKTGVTRDGRLTAKAVEFIWDTGAYAEGLSASNRALKDGAGPYRIPHLEITSTLVYTNKLRGCPYRGMGIAEAVWAGESQMDMIAGKLGIDPVELRLKNCLEAGDLTPGGDVAVQIALKECIEKVSAAVDWGEKPMASNRGIGFALLHKSPPTSATSSNAYVRIDENGVIELSIGASDVNGWTGTSLAQIVAEELGVRVVDVRVVIADTHTTPFDHGTFSSRVLSYVGQAVKLGAIDARRQILEAAATLWGMPAEALRLVNGKVIGAKRKSMKVGDVIRSRFAGEKSILGKGVVEGKKVWAGGGDNNEKTQLDPGWPFGAQAVEVEVERETGVVKVLRVVSAHDVGKAINPGAVAGQIQGGIVMGMGYALFEELCFDEGRITNPGLGDYKVATSKETPQMLPIIVEKPYRSEPYGAKGVGEVALFGIAPAIANAVASATGVRIKDLPITAEKILARLKLKESSRDG